LYRDNLRQRDEEIQTIRAKKRLCSNILSTLCRVTKKKGNKPQNASSCFIEPSLEATVLQTFCLHCWQLAFDRLFGEKRPLRTEARSKRAFTGAAGATCRGCTPGTSMRFFFARIYDIAGNAPLSMHALAAG